MKILYIENKLDIEEVINKIHKEAFSSDAYSPSVVTAVDYIVAPIHILKSTFVSPIVNSKYLEFGSLVVNTMNNEILVKGKPISLSRREYDLLVFIGKNYPRISTVSSICTYVWKEYGSLLSNTIEVHVNRINKKLGNKYIKCIKGFGYKLIID